MRAVWRAVMGTAMVAGLWSCGTAHAASDPARRTPAQVFTTAIDAYLVDHPERICTPGFALPYDVRLDGHDDPADVAAREDTLRWLDGLTTAGLLIKTRTTAYAAGDSPPIPLDEYVLSDAGAQAADDLTPVRSGAPVRFCLAQTQVAQVWVLGSEQRDGAAVTAVRYRSAAADVAPWVTTPATRRAMPWLSSWIVAQATDRNLTMQFTGEDWIVR
jgi:hypothetical protein